jgi:CheY-like chemotaxis protein
MTAPGSPIDPPPSAGNRAAVPLRILVADDNEVNMELISRYLTRRGHTVAPAATGKEVLNSWEREAFDAILMDVQMPEMDGYAATSAIRERERTGGGAAKGKRVPIIAVTANAMAGDKEKCLAAGMDGYVSKPINRQQLFEVVERLATPAGAGGASAGGGASGTGTESPSVAEGPVVDEAELLAATFDDFEFLGTLARKFRGNYPGKLATLRQQVAAADAKGAHETAHALAGSLGSMQARGAEKVARELMADTAKPDLSRAAALTARLEALIARADAELTAILAKAPPGTPPSA